jgi:hypothetical protein
VTEGACNSISELHRQWAGLENECHRLGIAIARARDAGADVKLLRDRQARLFLEISAVVAAIRDAPAATMYDYLALLDVAIEHEIDLSIDMACYGPGDFPMFARLLRGLARMVPEFEFNSLRRSLSSSGQLEQLMGEDRGANGVLGVRHR